MYDILFAIFWQCKPQFLYMEVTYMKNNSRTQTDDSNKLENLSGRESKLLISLIISAAVMVIPISVFGAVLQIDGREKQGEIVSVGYKTIYKKEPFKTEISEKKEYHVRIKLDYGKIKEYEYVSNPDTDYEYTAFRCGRDVRFYTLEDLLKEES